MSNFYFIFDDNFQTEFVINYHNFNTNNLAPLIFSTHFHACWFFLNKPIQAHGYCQNYDKFRKFSYYGSSQIPVSGTKKIQTVRTVPDFSTVCYFEIISHMLLSSSRKFTLSKQWKDPTNSISFQALLNPKFIDLCFYYTVLIHNFWERA